MTLRIAIIGPARGDDLTVDIWNQMLSRLQDLLKPYVDSKASVILVSGGAAFSDHSAVMMAKKYQLPLELHLPCSWDKKKRQHLDTGEWNWRKNPGSLANKLHKDFSKVVGISSLGELDDVIRSELCTTHVYSGFHERNISIGKADILIAFCRGDVPISGGTLHTWSNSSSKKKIAINILPAQKKG